MLTLILIPSISPKPNAAKKERTTSPTPQRVIRTLDSITSKLIRKSADTTAITTMEIVVSFPLDNVMSSSNFSVVPDAPTALERQAHYRQKLVRRRRRCIKHAEGKNEKYLQSKNPTNLTSLSLSSSSQS